MERRRSAAIGLAVAAVGAIVWACSLETTGVGPLEVRDAAMDLTVADDVARAPDVEVPTGDAGVDAGDAAEDVTDAGSDAPDAAACLAACDAGTCVNGRCHIACTSTAPCTSDPCPPGVPCTVTCSGTQVCSKLTCTDCKIECLGNQACTGNMTCTSCDVRCDGVQACPGNVKCTGPGCAIRCCNGSQSCGGNLDCTGAGCGIYCIDAGACTGNVVCNGGVCADAGLSCK